MLQEYHVNLTRLVQPIDSLHEKKTKILWALQEPINEDKLKAEFQMVTNEQINLYNRAAVEVRISTYSLFSSSLSFFNFNYP